MSNKIEFKIVSSPEELHQAFSIRTLVYIGEQNCPWAEEFDGNDFTVTHIIGLIDGEPVATARIRWFGSFAKLERLAIRIEHRGGGLGHRLLRYLLDICREKGFTRIYLHAQSRLTAFYAGYGFCSIGSPFGFSDHAYVEMVASLGVDRRALTLASGPHVLNRPEGNWSCEGVLERSQDRLDRTLVPSRTNPAFVPAFL